MADPDPVVAISFILELPRDLGLPHDSYAQVLREGPNWGWRLEDLHLLPGWTGAEEGYRPLTELRFRRARVGVGMPTEATDRCFGDMRLVGASRKEQAAYRRGLEKLVKRGAKEWKTVVRVTRWSAAEEFPLEQPDQDEWLRRQLTEGLAVLNEWLSYYGMGSGDPHAGPISLGDLPALIPFVLQVKDGPADDVGVATRLLTIHDRVPTLRAVEGSSSAAAGASALLVADPDAKVMMPGLAMLYQAQSRLVGGRRREAVVDAGTAVEMLVSAIYRTLSELRNDPPIEKRQNILKPGDFKGRFDHHLPLVLADPGTGPAPDLRNARADWFSKGYDVRRRAVHEGHEPTHAEATDAVMSAWAFVDAAGEQIRALSDFPEVGEPLRVAWHGEDS